MKFVLLCKRHYTNKDLLNDRFGRLFHLPVQLHKLGHEGLVIAGDLHTSKSEQKEINGIIFNSAPLSITALFPFIRHSRRLMEEFEPDVLLASGDSYFGYLGLKLAKERKIPFIFDVYDDYTAFGTNKFPGIKNLFSMAIRNADLIITAGTSLMNFVQDSGNKVVSIENGYDPDLFHPIPTREARQNLGIPFDDVVIGYLGSMEPQIGIENLIEASRLLAEKIPRIRLLLAGRDNLALDYYSHNVDYRGFLPQEKIPDMINASDVVVIPYLQSRLKQWCNACKIAEYVACRKPVVATRIADHAKIFADAPQSLCNPGDTGSMVEAIEAQLHSPQVIGNTEDLTWHRQAEKLHQSLVMLTAC